MVIEFIFITKFVKGYCCDHFCQSVCVCVCVCVCVSVCHFVNTIDDDEYEFGKFHFLCMDIKSIYCMGLYHIFSPYV